MAPRRAFSAIRRLSSAATSSTRSAPKPVTILPPPATLPRPETAVVAPSPRAATRADRRTGAASATTAAALLSSAADADGPVATPRRPPRDAPRTQAVSAAAALATLPPRPRPLPRTALPLPLLIPESHTPTLRTLLCASPTSTATFTVSPCGVGDGPLDMRGQGTPSLPREVLRASRRDGGVCGGKPRRPPIPGLRSSSSTTRSGSSRSKRRFFASRSGVAASWSTGEPLPGTKLSCRDGLTTRPFAPLPLLLLPPTPTPLPSARTPPPAPPPLPPPPSSSPAPRSSSRFKTKLSSPPTMLVPL